MKTKKRMTVPSMIRPTHKFTAREREAWLEWQRPDAGAPLDWLTPHEAGEITRRLSDNDVSPHASMHADEFVRERKGELTSKMTPPLHVALATVAAMVIEDNGNTMDDATQDKLEEVTDAVETCWLDPEPPESWTVDTAAECSIDVPKFLAHVRKFIAETLAGRDKRSPETLDEFYRMVFNAGGRQQADNALRAMRASGALGLLRITKGITHVVDRDGYARLLRGIGRPYYCSDPYCEGDGEHYTWDEVEELAEDGRIAVHVRRQERRDGSWVTAIAGTGTPSSIEAGIEKRNKANGYVVVQSEEVAA
jgi:hypothetical protein